MTACFSMRCIISRSTTSHGALPERFGKWNSVWRRFDRLSKAGVFEYFFATLAGLSHSAHLVQTFGSTVADKGYDSATDRQPPATAERCRSSHAKAVPERFARTLHRGRARIEQAVGKLKRFTLRCEKTARNFRSVVALAAIFNLVKSVHTA